MCSTGLNTLREDRGLEHQENQNVGGFLYPHRFIIFIFKAPRNKPGSLYEHDKTALVV